jgi:Ca-activated chloride channel family protein
MWKFEYVWMFALLPLPLFVWWLAPAYRTTSTAVRMPFFQEMAHAAGEKPAPGGVRLRRNWLQRLLMPVLWILLLIAAARPVFLEPPVTHELPARDLLLAIDLSQSMSERDFIDGATGERLDRLSAVKRVVADFIAKRKGDRIGLIVFGDGAYPQAPLTLDHDSVLMLLDAMRIGMAGPRTAIGDAIGLAVRLMENTPAQEKVLILLTDGNDTASAIAPTQAAQIAKHHGIVVHTIGIGDPQTEGEDKVDLDALTRIARTTGGTSFHAMGRAEDIASVYAQIDKMTPEKITREVYRPRREFYWLALALAVSLFSLYHGIACLVALLRAPRRVPGEIGA